MKFREERPFADGSAIAKRLMYLVQKKRPQRGGATGAVEV
jgi:hypothetical protein